MASNETIEDYISRLKERPDKGSVTIIGVYNERSQPINLYLEPWGDHSPGIMPGAPYDVVAQGVEGADLLEIYFQDDAIKVWSLVEECQVFSEGQPVAY